jgi:hypothetical protein
MLSLTSKRRLWKIRIFAAFSQFSTIGAWVWPLDIGIYWIVEQRLPEDWRQVKLAPKCDWAPLELDCCTAAENVIANTVAKSIMMVKRRARMTMSVFPLKDHRRSWTCF